VTSHAAFDGVIFAIFNTMLGLRLYVSLCALGRTRDVGTEIHAATALSTAHQIAE
jgi:hypothetical protein